MGLDVHDAGGKDTVLEKGMVISWEPGIYIPEENIGIRIEDDILVDDDPINLSENIPKDPGVIESLMHQKEKS
jgi:Xaa-Pro aminopeptidase